MDATLRKRGGAGVPAWAVGLGLLACLFAAFPKVMLGLESFVYRDYGVLGYPFIQFHHESFWRGEFPFWNPYSNCGAPFMAQWGTMTLYPGSLIYLLLPLPWSLGFFCLLHLALGGAGMFALARRWVGNDFAAGVAAMAFVFCGTTFSSLMWPNYTVALGWMPWVILLVERSSREGGRWLIGAAIGAAMQLLSGVPELVSLTWVLIGCLAVSEAVRGDADRWGLARRFGMVVVVAAGLVAVQLLPFADLLEQSQRDRSLATSKWAMPLWGVANLLVPLFHCRETMQGPYLQPGQAFLGSYYPGAAVMLLAAWALRCGRERRVWIVGALVLFSFLMACGENGFLYPLVKRFIPLLGVARYPVKFLFLAAFGLPLLAAFAVRDLQSSEAAAGPRRTLFVIFTTGTVALIAGIVWMSWQHPWQSAGLSALENSQLAYWEWRNVGPNAAVRAALLIFIASSLLAVSRIRSLAWRRSAQAGVLAALFIDGVSHVPAQNPSAPASVFASNLLPGEDRLRLPRLGEGRVLISPGAEDRLLFSAATNLTADFLGKRLALWSNLNLLDQVPKVNGSSTLQLRQQMQVQSLIYSGTNKFDHGLIEMLGVTRYSPPSNPTEWRSVTNSCAFLTCGQRPLFADAARTLSELAGPDFNPHTQVYLRPEDQGRVHVTEQTDARIISARIGAGVVEAEVEAGNPALVVISQSYAAGWRASVDGKPALLMRANHAFQALEVPAGRHRVHLIYRDRGFVCGGMISVLTLAACAVGWIWLRRAKMRVVPRRDRGDVLEAA
jgi:hypothetical protein